MDIDEEWPRLQEQMLELKRFISLIIMIIVLQDLYNSKVKVNVVLIFRLCKVIKLVLWTCGDIEKNPGPTSPGYAKIAAMRELTPILYKIINGLKPESKAPNKFYKDDKYKPPGFKMEMLDPNNCKTLAKTKQLEELFLALVEYCDENAFPIPDRYRDEIQALQANDFASLENRRSFRHFEEDLNGFVQKAIDNGPEAINQTLKILKEKENFLRSKKSDDTATENQTNKRKQNFKDDFESHKKRLRTVSENQKRNEPVASTGYFNPNQRTSITDSDFTDSTQDCVSGMCNSNQSSNTPGKLDVFCTNDQKENQNESDDLKIAQNNDISDEQHRMTVSAHEDNQPKANDILCQKRNKPVVSTSFFNPNQHASIADSDCTNSTQDCVSGMCISDQSLNTPGKSDAFCANDQKENQHKSDDLKTASYNDISDEQHRMTVSAHEDNQPKANDIICQKRNETVVLTTYTNTNQRSASACSHYAVLTQTGTSEQGTHDEQNAAINSDEFLLSTDQLQTIESSITESTGLSVDTWIKQLNLQ